MLSRNIASRSSTLLRRAIRAQSTQAQVEESSLNGPIAADGRHGHDESYDEIK